MMNRPQIKSEARQMIRTAAVSPLIMTAIMLLITFVLDRISDLVENGYLFYTYLYNAEYMQAVISGDFSSLVELVDTGSLLSPMSIFFSVLLSLFTIVLNGGYYAYCIGIRQGLQMPYSSLLDGLSVSGKLIWCGILMGIKTFLWSMLFLIPGLIAVYRYRFAYYNILTDPALSANEAIKLSCRQTYGMKGSLFALDLSFIGWVLLSMVLSNLFSRIGLYLAAAAASIAIQVWVTPYLTLCDLVYFEEGQRRVGRPPYGGSDVPPNASWEL